MVDPCMGRERLCVCLSAYSSRLGSCRRKALMISDRSGGRYYVMGGTSTNGAALNFYFCSALLLILSGM
jgi:hypothetical protein